MRIMVAISLFGFLCLGALTSGVVLWRSWTQVYTVPSRSMTPTLQPKDAIIADKRAYHERPPQRGDIALFVPPPQVYAAAGKPTSPEIHFVMRVVAVPGDKFEIVKRRLHLNGKLVSDPGATWTGTYSYDCKIVNGKVYTREYDLALNPVGEAWTTNSVIVPEEEQQKISKSPTGTVPKDKFLVLGDNRSNANDSHVWGFLSRDAFRGRATSIISPENHRRSF